MEVPAYLVQEYGPERVEVPPEGGFVSRGEEVVWYELKRRRIEFRYQWHPGDIPYTPGREEESADFQIPALRLIIQVNDPFTHPSPAHDAMIAQKFLLLGFMTYVVWTSEIVPEQGGNVRKALDKIPGLAFFGQFPGRDTARRRMRRFGQPARDITFRQPWRNPRGF